MATTPAKSLTEQLRLHNEVVVPAMRQRRQRQDSISLRTHRVPLTLDEPEPDQKGEKPRES
jgi:hypothetical protein